MAEVYKDIIKGQIGRVKATAQADNYFPIVGQTVHVDAVMKWAQSTEWQMKDGSGQTSTSAGTISGQKDSKDVVIANPGELQQRLVARNYLTETVVSKTLYAMLPQVLPYFDVTATEVVRVGDTGYLNITAENGYPTSRSNVIVARIYKENASEPVKNIGFDTSRPGPTVWASSIFFFDNASDRGIYDVEVDVTDSLTGITLTKRINKLITVTPKLCPKPADTTQGYETVATYRSQTSYGGAQTFELRLWRDVGGSGLHYAEAVVPLGDSGYGSYDRIPVHLLPAGTTLCLKRDNNEPDADYPFRFLPTGNNNVDDTNENGSPNFSYEKPLVITHDEAGIMQWKWWAFGAVNLAHNLRNLVLDGRGYHNTSIRFFPDETKSSNSCFFLVAGTSEFEMFSCDVDGAGFAGVSAKTDPSPNVPHFWRSSGWEMTGLKIHHCTFRNTAAEGVYLGYYGSGKLSGTNASGQKVEYFAHLLRGLRLYRCDFYHNGYDSIQVNNSVEAEICYCNVEEAGVERVGGQGYAFSSVFDGKIYNCIIKGINGAVGYMFPLMTGLYVYNNVFVAATNNTAFVITCWKSGGYDYVDKDQDGVDNEIEYEFYNNVIKAASIASFNSDFTFGKFRMDDNVFITENGNTSLPGSFAGNGNIFLKGGVDYDAIDAALKVADSANGNFQPAHDSLLVTAGKRGKSPFDMRGYKNWFMSNFHAGAFMGIYKDASIVDKGISLQGITINDGAADTMNRNVSVQFSYIGDPTKYRMGENSDLSGVSWQAWTGDTASYTLSEAVGSKVLYAQIADNENESSVVSQAIVYSTSVQFADTETKKICVNLFDNDGDGELKLTELLAVASIGRYNFSNNKTMRSFDELKLFTGLENIDAYAFSGCTALESISFPDHLTTLKTQICQGDTALKSVHLPASLTSLGGACFNNCSSLKHIDLPEGITALDDFANTGLEEINIPDSVESIKGFAGCVSLRKVDIGTGVTTFKQNAFNGCTALEIFIMRAPAVPAYAGWALPDGFAGTIYVPDTAVDAYKAANGWKNFASRIKPLSEYTKEV